MKEATDFIAEQGWTPQVKPRRNGLKYLYAAKRNNTKVIWRYICPLTKVGALTEDKILYRLTVKKIA